MCRWIVLGGVLALLTPGLLAYEAPSFDARLAADTEPGGYNVYLTLADTGPHQRVLLDWAGGKGLVVKFDSQRTTLSVCDGRYERVAVRGAAAHLGQVQIKRRIPMVEVSQRGVVLLRTWSRRPIAGQVAPSAEAHVTDIRVQPVGDVHFHDDFFEPEAVQNTWEPLRGTWTVGIYRDPLIARDGGPIGASWYETKGAHRALVVTGYDFWDRYRARVAVQAVEGTRVGLAFYCQDAKNYALLSVRPGQVEAQGVASLILVREGEELVLAEGTVAWRAGTWYELAVEAVNERVRCYVSGAKVFEAALPLYTSGRVGLFADGPGLAKFDDVDVQPMHVARDDFERPELGECWETSGGQWRLMQGYLRGHSKRLTRALRVGAGWDGTTVSVDVIVRVGAAGICLNWTGGSGYILSVEPTQYTFAKFMDGKKTILDRGSLAGVDGLHLELSYQEGRLFARARSVEKAVYDFDIPGGACGLFVAGDAQFDNFRARKLEPPGAEISHVSGAREYIPGEREGLRMPVLGHVWQPAGTRWYPTALPNREPGIRAVPRGNQPTVLWYAHPCTGDVSLTAEGCALSSGAVLGLAVACDNRDIRSGYAVELIESQPVRLHLLRQGVTVAETERKASPGEELSLWRDGNFVVAKMGRVGLAYKDGKPLIGEQCCVYVSGGDAVVHRIRLGNRRARYYAFREVETDWQPQEGQWLVHSGMACMDWDYWFTGKGLPRAMCYNIHPQPRNLQVDFWVSEYTEGYASGEHYHYPYYNINLVTCAESRSLDSGYRFLIAGERGQVTRLLRLGKVVAETRDPRFRIIRIGGHNAFPRVLHVTVIQRDGRLSLRLNGAEALRFTDPAPLDGGYVGIGVSDCPANFRDFWMAPLRLAPGD